MAEQTSTPLDVLVAHQRQDIGGCLCGWSELGQSFCQHQIDALNAAGFAIVRKVAGDQLEAALLAFTGEYPYPTGRTPLLVDAMAAALEAAAAADGRTPDDRTKALVDRVRGLRAKYDDLADDERGTQSGGMARDFSDELCAALCEWEGRADRCDAAKSRSSTTSEGRTPDDLDESAIAEALRVGAESSHQQEGGYWIEGYTDDLARAVVAALKGETDE